MSTNINQDLDINVIINFIQTKTINNIYSSLISKELLLLMKLKETNNYLNNN